MEINRERIEKSFKYLEILQKENDELIDFCNERAKKLIPFFEPPYKSTYSKYLPDEPTITEFGVKLKNSSPYGSLLGISKTPILEWKYIEMTEEEVEEEIKRIEQEKKQKEIADLECKIAKLRQ